MASNTYNNRALSNLKEAITAAATTIYIQDGDYVNFLPSDGDYVYLVLRNPSFSEVVKVDVANSSVADGLTVERGIDGTNRAWNRGTVIFQTLTAEDMNNFRQKGDERGVVYNPNYTIAPNYLGENLIETGDYDRIWKSINATDKTWKLIGGDAIPTLFVAVAATGSGDRVMTSPDGITWTSRSESVANQWDGIAYGNDRFVAVSMDGTGDRVMVSQDGTSWGTQTSAADNQWRDVVYGNGLFVAVARSGTNDRVMTSPDGITWTSRNAAAEYTWENITYGNGLFVATAIEGTSDGIMTSPDGINWTLRSTPSANYIEGITYANNLFVAMVAQNYCLTSPDGITWTERTMPSTSSWITVTYGNDLFVAIARKSIPSAAIATSPDGITWTARTCPGLNTLWRSITYGNSTFVVVGSDVDYVMTSSDGITWTTRTAAELIQWRAVAYGA